MKRTEVIKARRGVAERLPDPTQILRGSLLERTVRNKRGCPKCARGEGHRVWVLTVSYGGRRTRQFSIRPEQRAQVEQWLRNCRELNSKLEAICQLTHELLRPDEQGSFSSRRCVSPRQMKKQLDPSPLVRGLIEAHFSVLRKTVRRNLTRLTAAFLRLAVSVRFGYGGLHLTWIARTLPEGTTFKSNYKWLSRFLKNRYFDPASLAEGMLALILGRKAPTWTLVLFDQTTINGVQVVNAAIPLEGRAVPVAWVGFEYPWTTRRRPRGACACCSSSIAATRGWS